ncbi:LytTR family transcriptional regulator DNA-binding domain-containing protein [Cohnella herbarum]|uniref:LytTR family transcriptional regulator n=1 Tax=Cohnella herbarum TaxID=2728023 RepID=A0A7Z2ZLY2_9BACL|nr:LytTR family transcriptional regulator DNA-binding domain-containing protein [Cohnella herbarum]QJD84488.1 LytTR family transcriptional regulator [Cohnella herbarum]
MEWIKELPVSRDPKGATGIVSLPLDSILYIHFYEAVIQVHTATEMYYFTLGSNLSLLVDNLNNSGFHFEKTDRAQVADYRRISHIEKTEFFQYRGYFEGTAKYVIFSESNYRKAAKILKDRSK